MDIYEALDKVVSFNDSKIDFRDFNDFIRENITNEKDKELFDLLKGIISLGYTVDENGITFRPKIILLGRRSFSIEDISDAEYELLKELEIERLPLYLRAKLADVLWTTKKWYKYATVAAVSYLDLFKNNFSDDDWVSSLDMMRRALFISLQINNLNLCQECHELLYGHLLRINGEDENFLSINLVEIVLSGKKQCGEDLLNIIENIINKSKINKNVRKVEEAYKLKINWLKQNKKQELIKNVNIELAEFYVDIADDLIKNDSSRECFDAEKFYKEAALLFRNNGCNEECSKTMEKLVDVQKKIPNLMVSHNYNIDISKITKNIELNFKGLTFEQAVMRLTQLVSFHRKEDVKKEVLHKRKKYVLSSLFGKTIINEYGQTILTLPALGFNSNEDNQELIEQYINQEMLQLQEIEGNVFLRKALEIIKSTYSFNSENLSFVVKNNPIIPSGRERIFQNAIYMVLNNQCYETIHILAPQVENLFRILAKELGDITITLENDGASKEKVLSAIFDLPKLKDSYDNDILFEFKGLLNEPSGANLRNLVAHGLLGDRITGCSLYFLCAVIKLLSFTSKECYEIFMTLPKYNGEGINDFEIEEQDCRVIE